jgi:hypothetical protein
VELTCQTQKKPGDQTKEGRQGRHVGLDFYDLLIEVLYRRRAFTPKVEASRALRRAFDKAVRRKPAAFAADAGGYAY